LRGFNLQGAGGYDAGTCLLLSEGGQPLNEGWRRWFKPLGLYGPLGHQPPLEQAGIQACCLCHFAHAQPRGQLDGAGPQLRWISRTRVMGSAPFAHLSAQLSEHLAILYIQQRFPASFHF
jgi:hypothetical protein